MAQLHQLERALEESPDQGDTESLPPYESQPSSPQEDRLIISPPKPDITASNAVIRMPTGSLAEIDESIPQTAETSEQIVTTSALVVDSLLEKWTRLPPPGAPLTPLAPQNGYSPFREERQYTSEYSSYAKEEPPQASTRENKSDMPRDIGPNGVVREPRQPSSDYGYHAREDAPPATPGQSGLVTNVRDAGLVGKGDAGLGGVVREPRQQSSDYGYHAREDAPPATPGQSGLVTNVRDAGLVGKGDAGLGGVVREQWQQPSAHNYYVGEPAPPVNSRDSGPVGSSRDAGSVIKWDAELVSTRDAGLLSPREDGQGRYIEDRRRLYLEDGKPRSRRSKKKRVYVQPQVESDSDDSEELRYRRKSKSPRHSHRVLESDEDSSTSDSESEEERERRRQKHRTSGEHKRRDSDTNRGSFSRPPEMPAFRRPNTTPNLHGYPNPLGQPNINYGGPPSPAQQPIPISNIQHQYRASSVSSPMVSPSGYPQHPPLQGHRSYPGPVQYPQQQHLRPPPPPEQQYQPPSSPNKRNSSRHHSRDKHESSASDKKQAVKAGAKAAGWAAGIATLLEGLDGI